MSTVEKRRSPTGNSKQRALRKLRTTRPDLYEEVKGGQKKAAAAMREAGFVKTLTPLDLLKKAWMKASEGYSLCTRSRN